MKKILIVLISLLVLCACSNGPTSTKISNGSDVFYESPDGKKVTKQEIYDNAKKAEITTYLVNSISLKIAKNEGIDVDALREDAEKYVEDLEKQGYDQFISYYYGSKEAYIQNSTVYSAVNELCKNEVRNTFDSVVTQYTPYQAEVAMFDNEEEAKKILEACGSDASKFIEICQENEYQGDIQTTIYNSYDNVLPDEVDTYISTANKGLSPIIKTQTVTSDSEGNSSATDRYYLINLVSKDVNDFKEDFIEYAASQMDQETIIVNFINKYGIVCHDQDIYECLKAKYGEVIK